MSYAVFHIIKANSSLNSIAKHIERTSHPDNADPRRTHLNRYGLVEYPDGITGLAAAVEHRIANAGITRKISDRQVRCLNMVMTSDNEGMQKIIDAGKLDQWIADNIKWVRDTFGSDNVVGAALHMDERTPHLHIAVVPIVTTERKKKAREAAVKKRYRTKPTNRPRLCADDIMERKAMSRYQDLYAEAMAKYELERGVRGSEARHIDQHEYYRQCQREKAVLEKDVAELSTEKKKLDKEKKSLESKVGHLECSAIALDAQKKQLRQVNEEIRQTNRELYSENTRLTEANSSLAAENKSLMATSSILSDDVARLQMQKLSNEANGDFQKYKADIARYFPDLEDLLRWGRYCTHIGFPDRFTQRILAQEKVGFAGTLFSSEHNQTFSTEGSYAKLERDPKEKHRFILTIDGINVFQWFRDMARKLLEKLGFQPKEPRQSRSIRR